MIMPVFDSSEEPSACALSGATVLACSAATDARLASTSAPSHSHWKFPEASRNCEPNAVYSASMTAAVHVLAHPAWNISCSSEHCPRIGRLVFGKVAHEEAHAGKPATGA